MKRNILLHLAACVILILSACNLPANNPNLQETSTPEANPLPQTDTPIPFTATPEFTATAESTATPEFTATPSVPIVSVSQSTNCRSGPGVEYDLLSGLNPGQTAEIVGKSTITNYWIIKTPSGSGICWLWGQYASVSGNIANLPEYPVPPTPTPAVPSAPKNLNANVTCVSSTTPFLHKEVTVNLSWTDTSSNEDGFRLYRNGTELLGILDKNTTSYVDHTSLPSIWLAGDPPPSVTYDLTSFNTVGTSNTVSIVVKCG